MFNLDQAIAEWRRKMIAAGIKSREVLDELESHLREDIEHQTRSGGAAEQAFHEAVLRVGSADTLNREFGKISVARARLSPGKLRIGCLTVAVFIFAIETWTVAIYELTAVERFLGMAFVSIISFYIGALPDLNRRIQRGVRGWAMRNAVGIVCNGFVISWTCMLLLSLANIRVLPDGMVPNVICWGLCAAAAFTLVVLAYGTEPEMLNVWSPDTWRSFQLAEAEAVRFCHDFIGTEHVLLGLIAEESSTVSVVLRKMGVSCETVRGEIEKIVGNGPQGHSHGPPACTPRAKKALQIAVQEAKAAGQNCVEPEHIFLGLLREGSGVAAVVLKRLGTDVNAAREQIQKTSGNRKDKNA